MGLDMDHQAVPAGSGLIERAREDPDLGQSLFLAPYYFRRGPWPNDQVALRQSLNDLSQRYPGIETRNLDLDRCWDKLDYLLSPKRREPGSERDSLLDKAVRGGEEIGKHVTGGQGIPVRYVSPSDVKAIAALLQPMSAETLKAHYDPEKMEEAAVYCFWAERADEAEWRFICELFEKLRQFYLLVAEHGEGIIVCLD